MPNRAWWKQRIGPVVRALVGARTDPPPSSWGLSAVNGRLSYEGVDLHELAHKHGTPLHVVLGRRLDENAAAFTARPAGARRGCEVLYSYKTNPVPGVLARLHRAGVGAEVISPYELWLASKLGVDPSRIVYNGPAKSDVAIEAALRADVASIHVNHREEIARIAAIAARVGVRARVGLRTSSTLGWAGQFGVGSGAAAVAAFAEALACPTVEVTTIHCHLGRPIDDEATLHAFLDDVLSLLDRIAARTGFHPPVIDFGGSLAATKTAPISPWRDLLNRAFHVDLPAPDPLLRLQPRTYVAVVLHRVQQWAAARGRPVPRILIEPGRALTSDAQLLLSRVITTKADGDATWAILDAGVNVAEAAKHEQHQLFAVNRCGEPATHPHRLAGPICTPGDVLYASWRLPRLRPGDTVAILDAGAYFVPFSTSFSFPRPGIVEIDGGRVRTLRRAETFDDLVALDDLDPDERTSASCASSSPAAPGSSVRTSASAS